MSCRPEIRRGSYLRSVIVLLCVLSVEMPGQAQNSQYNLAAPLQITDTNYVHTPDRDNPGRETAVVTFVVRNESSRPLVAYSVQISGTFRDGTTKRMYGCDADLTDGIDWQVNNVGFKPTPPLGSGATRTCRYVFGARAFSMPISIAVTPLYAVLEDGTVMGDRSSAMHNFFEAQRAMAVVYAGHLADLRALDRATPEKIAATLAAISSDYQRPVKGTPGPASKTTPALAADYAKLQIASALVHVNQTVESEHSTPEARARVIAGLLRQHIAQIQRRYDSATKYSNPR